MLILLQLVITAPIKPRLKVQNAALETARNYEKEAVERLRRMSLVAADLEVKGLRRQLGGGGQPPSMLAQVPDLGYEESSA